jgi:hypothetical protein
MISITKQEQWIENEIQNNNIHNSIKTFKISKYKFNEGSERPRQWKV